jgi:hypothetical protein
MRDWVKEDPEAVLRGGTKRLWIDGQSAMTRRLVALMGA